MKISEDTANRVKQIAIDSLTESANIDKRFEAMRYSILLTQCFGPMVSQLGFKLKNIGTHEVYKKNAEICTNEIESGYHFFNIQQTILLYSSLEAFIKKIVLDSLSNCDLSKIKEIANIKLSFIDYHLLDQEEKLDYLFSMYEKNQTNGQMYSVSRFEQLLSPLNLGGSTNKKVCDNIFELSQLRNNILHKNGFADRHLIKNCPSLNYAINDKVKISDVQLIRYSNAISAYMVTIYLRILNPEAENRHSMETVLNTTLKHL